MPVVAICQNKQKTKEQKKNTTCHHTARVVSSIFLDDVAVCMYYAWTEAAEITLYKQLTEVACTQQIPRACKHSQLCRILADVAHAYVNAASV